MTQFYFAQFEHRTPPAPTRMGPVRRFAWQAVAVAAIALGLRYLWWRWTGSLNPEALVFSAVVAAAETAMFIGLVLFVWNLWDERDPPRRPPPARRADVGLPGPGPVTVDLFITTYDEDPELVRLSVRDALAVRPPPGCAVTITVLDDGARPAMARIARECGVGYLSRSDNTGFKAGNLKNGLAHTSGDFVVICDADTRLFPAFLADTLGYFRDRRVAWVQTPHWFYDLPPGFTLSWALRRAGMAWLAVRLPSVLRRTRLFRDPFASDPGLFFDVIQRRRNRHGASFCCGAASIHRREALMEAVLADGAHAAGRACESQPFRFHVSEDIYTSIRLHGREGRWTSVQHPDVLARMLSPWGLHGWGIQRTKYARGSVDIALNDCPLFARGLSWPVRLHYAATFWSYLTAPALLVLMLAPAIAIATGTAPVAAFSDAFFRHLLPFLAAVELAIVLGTWGQANMPGRQMQMVLVWINLGAILAALRGRRSDFRPTPKSAAFAGRGGWLRPHAWFLATCAVAIAIGLRRYLAEPSGTEAAALVLNGFWMLAAVWAVGRFMLASGVPPAVYALDPTRAGEAQGARIEKRLVPSAA